MSRASGFIGYFHEPRIGGRQEREREQQRKWGQVPKHPHVDYLEYKGTISIAPVQDVEAVTSAIKAAILASKVANPAAVEFKYWPNGRQPSLAIDLRGSCADGDEIRSLVGTVTAVYSEMVSKE